MLGSELNVEYLRATLNPLDRYVVVVDDAEMLYNAPNSEILERIIVSGRDADHGLVLAGTTADLSSCYSGFIATARKSRCGVLMAVDTPDDGDLFGVRLPRNAGPCPLGRGLLFRAGRAAPIQLAVDEVPSEAIARRRRGSRWRRPRAAQADRRLIAWRESLS